MLLIPIIGRSTMEGQEMNNSDTPLISPSSNDTSYSDWLASQSSQVSFPEEPPLPPLTNVTDEPMLVEEDEELNNTSQPILLPPTKNNDTDPLEEWVLELGDNEEEEELSVNNNSSSLPIVESLTNEHNDTESTIVISETKSAPSTAPTSLSSDSISSSTFVPSNSPSYHSTIASTLTTSSSPSSIPSSFDSTTNPPTYRRNEVLGCSPMHYKLYTNEQQLKRRNNATDSLLKLYMEEILPNTFLKLAKKHDLHSANPIVVQYINDDEELFIKKDGALYPGVVTTNDIYELIKDDMFVPLGHSIKGDQITQIIDSMNDNGGGDDRDRQRVLVENYMMVEEGEDTKTNNIVGYAVEKKPAQIKDSSKYTLYTVSNNEYAVSSIMESLDIPIVTSLPPNKSEYLITNKSVRSVWIDYVKMEWPYDDNDCEGLNDQINDGDASSGGGSSGVSSTTSTSSSPNKEHGGKTVHHHDTYSDIATGKDGSSVQSPSSRGSSMESGTSSHSNSVMSILLILTAMGAIIFFVIKARRPGHKKQSWETTISRQSELGGSSNNNDLELQVEDDKPDVAGSYGPPTGGYSSPAIGTFI